MLALNSLLIIERTYPDSIAGFLQDLIAALPAMWIIDRPRRKHLREDRMATRRL